jgi:transcriptional regulator with XRE-family HTH domain
MQSVLVKLVASNVRRLRAARGWSQEDLADHCGLHRTYVGAIERSERNLTLATLERLAAALEVEPTELLSEPRRGRPPRG